jgi:hypothetical protein
VRWLGLFFGDRAFERLVPALQFLHSIAQRLFTIV